MNSSYAVRTAIAATRTKAMDIPTVIGAMKNWDRWADLSRIKTRTLVLGAKYDEMDPEDLRKMGDLMPHARAWISDKGSHFTMYDDQLPYFTELLTFLKSA